MSKIEIVGDSDVSVPLLPTTNTVIYTRVSSEREDRQTVSPDAQREICRRYCQFNGLLDPVVVFERKSAKNISGRPELQRVLQMCRTGQIKHLVIQDLTRLFRDVRDALNTFDELEDMGVTIHSATKPIDLSTADGRFVAGLDALLSERERQVMSERIKRAKAQARANGRPNGGGSLPFGLKWGGIKGYMRQIPNKVEIAHGQRMLELHRQGLQYRQIALKLIQENVKNRFGGRYARSRIHQIVVKLKAEEANAQQQREAGPDVLQGVHGR